MGLPNVNITLGSGLGRRATGMSKVSGLILPLSMSGVFNEFDIVELNSLEDCELLNEELFAYQSVKRFYKHSPGAKLYVEFTSDDKTFDVADSAEIFRKLIDAGHGLINQIGIVVKNTETYASDNTFVTVLPLLQNLADSEFAAHRPLVIVIGAMNVSMTGTLADLRGFSCPNVAVLAGRDIINTGNQYAMGDFIGCLSAAKVNESVAWVDRFNLTDVNKGVFVGAAFGGVAQPLERTYLGIHDKGYIFALHYVGRDGFNWSGDGTCVPLTHDLAYLHNTRTINKAARLVYMNLVGRLESPVLLNKDGTIQDAVVGALEAVAASGLDDMKRDGEISNYDVYLDNTRNFLIAGEEVNIELKVQPVGVAHMINVTLKLSATV